MSENASTPTSFKKVKKGLLYMGLVFVGLFGLRVGYGFLTYPPGDTVVDNFSDDVVDQGNYFDGLFAPSQDYSVKNYASSRKTKTWEKGGEMQTATVDQKYEKVGTLSSATKNFEDDEEKLRGTIKEYDALIQYEQAQGMKGNRSLFLTIGVDPGKFDDMILDLRIIGKLRSIQINKTDKTNEFLDLKAQLATLEKTRNSLIELKSRSGSIEELMDLESRILETERQIQGLGVSLGDFDAENEFCTVKFTLTEYQVRVIPGIKILQRLRVAFVWTVKWFGALILGLLFASFTVWLLYEILRKLKWLPGWIAARMK